MGLTNAIGAFFRKYINGFTFGDQNRRVSLEQNAVFEIEVVGENNVQYDYEFQPKSGTVAHLDDIVVSNNVVQVIYILSSDLSGTGTLEEQVIEYINANITIIQTSDHSKTNIVIRSDNVGFPYTLPLTLS